MSYNLKSIITKSIFHFAAYWSMGKAYVEKDGTIDAIDYLSGREGEGDGEGAGVMSQNG